MSTPIIAFEERPISLPLDKILPVRVIKNPSKNIARYHTIVSSIREVGLVEPLIIHPQKGNEGLYLLLDGHLRLHALRELGFSEADCLISTDDESYTYNARVNRLPPIQEHRMIVKAVKSGVPIKRIAEALHLKVGDIKDRLKMLRGLCPEAVDLLKNQHISPPTLRALRKVKPIRQIEIAELMVSANNFTRNYAEALLLGTPKDMLNEPEAPKTSVKISSEDIARMEMEMENLERDYRAIEESYAENMLNLTVLRGYVRKLLANTKIVRFLSSRHGELLPELERIAATEEV